VAAQVCFYNPERHGDDAMSVADDVSCPRLVRDDPGRCIRRTTQGVWRALETRAQ
jgi:hypothetical protein